jgi:hypothetical protein
MLLIVFAPPQLENPHFVMPPVRQHLGRTFAPSTRGVPILAASPSITASTSSNTTS